MVTLLVSLEEDSEDPVEPVDSEVGLEESGGPEEPGGPDGGPEDVSEESVPEDELPPPPPHAAMPNKKASKINEKKMKRMPSCRTFFGVIIVSPQL